METQTKTESGNMNTVGQNSKDYPILMVRQADRRSGKFLPHRF